MATEGQLQRETLIDDRRNVAVGIEGPIGDGMPMPLLDIGRHHAVRDSRLFDECRRLGPLFADKMWRSTTSRPA
ncbi:hypothetical protein B1810_11070 [Panacagrimonas perspica]|nr:hypothetical protein B1810_11070 [Panacagrimonas perspica]